MAESSVLLPSSDGTLWNLAECTQEGEWTTGNIWQQKTKPPKTQTPGTDPEESSESDNAEYCPVITNLTPRWQRKVSLREESHLEGRGLEA